MAKATATLSALNEVQKHLEEVRPGQPAVINAAASPGDAVRQGDLYLIVVEAVPAGYKKAKNPSRQLVPGQTQGSKHILDSLEGVEVYLPQEWNEESLDGPCLVLTKERTVQHPVHGPVTIAAGHSILCRYQREYDKELARERRNRD